MFDLFAKEETQSAREMIFRVVLVCLLLRLDVRAEDPFERILQQHTDNASYCNFDLARYDYNATDLLQCIERLAIDLVDRESDRRLMDGKGQRNGSTGRQISFLDVFSSLLDGNPSTPHQSSPFPAYTTSGQHQWNRPVLSGGELEPSSGFQLNLFDALSSISRHDDYKCVPRILCEMASGKLPGRSLGEQWPGLFEFLGRNAFTDLLTKFDVATASPLLNFGRAMLLGYGNRGNPVACYEAFPKCPRDMKALVYYLNNYNGGFFRLFNRGQAGKYRENHDDVRIRDRDRDRESPDDHSRILLKGRIVSGARNDIRMVPVGNRLHFPIVNHYDRYEKQITSNYEDATNDNEIVFPEQQASNIESTFNSVQNHAQKSESNVWQSDNVRFFPRETIDETFSGFRFPSSFR